MAIIFTIAMLTNIDWARARLEALLSGSIHRRVQLGHLSWTFGFNGLAVETNTLRIYERDGSPFLHARRSEIGIAFWPLMSGQLQIRHISFLYPELWAVRTQKGVWSFDDLLQTAFNADFLEADRGKVHLLDGTTTDKAEPFPNTDLEDFNLKLVQPGKRVNRPFLLSFKIPHTGYATAIELSGLERHKNPDWRSNKCKLRAHAEYLQPSDLRTIATIFNVEMKDVLAGLEAKKISGLFNLDVNSEGVINDRFKAEVSVNAKGLSLRDAKFGQVTIPQLESSFHLKAQDKILSWSNSSFRLPDCQIQGRTEGKLTDWPALKASNCTASTITLVDDLSSLSRIMPDLQSVQTMNLKYLVASKGRAILDTDVNKTGGQEKFVSRLHLASVSLPKIEDLMESANIPMVALLGINDTARITGDVSINSDQRVEYKDCSLEEGGMVYKISGFTNPKEVKGRIEFLLKDFNLKHCAEAINHSAKARQSVATVVRLAPQAKLALFGKANINGVIEQKPGTMLVKCETSLKDVHVATATPRFTYERLSGTIQSDPDKFVVRHLNGFVENGGKLEISGTMPIKSSGTVDLHLQASNFNLANLSSLMQLFHVESPVFSSHQLSGTVKELSLDLKGSPANPTIQFCATPSELYYQSPGLADAIKCTSGTITYKNDNLDLKSVGMALRGGAIVTTLSIRDLSTKAKLDKIRIKTAGTDLKDAHYYLCSSLSPFVLKNLYQEFLKTHKLSGLHGKIYGDIGCTMPGGNPQIDGLIGFINAGAQVGDEKEPVEHVGGVLVASGNQLLFQGLNGSIHNNSFELDGRIKDYQEADPHWSGDLRANVDPVELSRWLPMLGGEQIDTDQFRLSAAEPLMLKAKLSGHNGASSGSFTLTADPEARVTFSGPFGLLHQPPGERLIFNANIKVDPQTIQASDARLLMGNSALRGEGSLRRQSPGNNKNANSDSEVSCLIHSTEQISLKSVIGLLDPSLANDNISGTVKGTLSLKGKLADPAISSELAFEQASFPQINLENCTGTINTAQAQRLTDGKGAIRAQLKMKSCALGKLLLGNITSDVDWFPSEGNLKGPRLGLANCKATLAGGKINSSGFIDLNERKISLKANVKDAEASKLLEQLTELKGELTGLLDADANFQSAGDNSKELIANLTGNCSISVRKGTVSRFRPLKARINQVNLVHQGLFGFNLNNLLQSVAPVRTGDFRKLETSLHLANERLSVDKLRYDGDDMQLWATGHANISLRTLELQIEGRIPRVSNSMIGGPFGGISREITVQKVMDSITLHKLESLPSLPLLGDFASNKPTTFAFKVQAPYDQPKLISQSIEKSFHWLQNKSAQTAHSVPTADPYGQL